MASLREQIASSLSTTSWTTVIFVGAVFCTLSYVVTAIYTWNRLRAFPAASWTAHFSYLWLGKTTYSGKQYWIHRELHKSRGPLVRVGPNELVSDDVEVMRVVNGTNSTWHRDPFYITGKFNPYHDDLFSLLDPQEHKRAKSRTISAYSGRETPDLEEGINSVLKTLLDVLETRYTTATPDAPMPPLLDLGHTSNYFTLDVITRLAFGKEFGYLREEKDHYGFLRSLHDLWPQMSTCADIPWIRNTLFSPLFLKLLGPKPTDKAGFGALMGVANHYVGLRFRPDAKPQQDMLGSMIKHGLNQVECETEGLFMIVAGTETTASKLKDEIHTAVREGRVSNPITFSESKKLPYLQAVIYEAIRMRPPLLGFIPKVVPKGGETILGQYVPGGTAIGTNLSAITRSTKLFGPDAELYRPERLMELDDKRRKQMERDIELAFGYGQWMCLGKSIALMEINKVVFEDISKVFRAFDMQLREPWRPSEILSYGAFIESNLMVKATKSAIVSDSS